MSGSIAYLIRRFFEMESKSKKAPSSSPNHMASISIDHLISLKSDSSISLSTSSENNSPSCTESWYGNPQTKSVLESSSMSLNVSSILLNDQWSLKYAEDRKHDLFGSFAYSIFRSASVKSL